MKKNFLFALLGVIVLGMSACSEKFNVAAPYKNITVLYSLLDINDTAHYIRVQKAFLDQNKSSVALAKVADSNFYPNIQVNVYGLYKNVVQQTFTTVRVDLNKEGYPKDSGAFFNTPSYAYKFKGALDPQYTYKVVVTNLATGEVDSAYTDLVDDNLSDQSLTISSLFNVANPSINFDTSSQSQYPYIITLPQDTVMVQAYFRLHWVDKNTSTGEETDHYTDWNFSNVNITDGSNHVTVYAQEIDMFRAFRSAMGPAPTGVERYIDSSDVMIYAGNGPVYLYSQFNTQPGVGLTGSDIQPTFTNILGKNALGLFGSIGHRTRTNVGFSNATLQYFINSGIMNNAPFSCNVKGVSDH